MIAMASRQYHLVQVGAGFVPPLETTTELSYTARLAQSEVEGGGMYDYYSRRHSPLGIGKVKHSGMYPLTGWPAGFTDGDNCVRQDVDFIQYARSVWTPFLFYSDIYTPAQNRYMNAQKIGKYLWAYGKITSVTNSTSISDYMGHRAKQVDIEGILRTPLIPVTWSRWLYGATAPSAVTAAVNLLFNPGFELTQAGGTGGINTFVGWTGLVVSGSVSAETSVPREKTTAAKLVASSGVTFIYQIPYVIPGKQYTLSFWSHGDGTHSASYSVYDQTNSSYIVGVTSTGVTSATTYGKTSVTFTSPSGCRQAIIQFYATAPATVYIDDVILTDSVLVQSTDDPALWYVPCELQPFCWNSERFWPRNLYGENLDTGAIEFDFTKWESPYVLVQGEAQQKIDVGGNTKPRTRCLIRGDSALTITNNLGTFTFFYDLSRDVEIYTDSWTGAVMQRDINFNVTPVSGAGLPPQLGWDDNTVSVRGGSAVVGTTESWIN